MGIGSVDLWLAGDLRMGKCVYGHHVAVDLLRQRSSHWLLLRSDVASQRSIGARVVLARPRKSSRIHDRH